jgi:hypothetical protein
VVRALLVVAVAYVAVGVGMMFAAAWIERRRIDRADRAARPAVSRWLARLLDGDGGAS